MDKIYIKNLEFIGNHGVFAEEKQRQRKRAGEQTG